MKNFQLSKDMLNSRGQFYPTNHILALFPGAEAAQAAGRALVDGGIAEEDISLITPEVMLRDIAKTTADTFDSLPSAGTEGDTVLRFADYARKGHHALLIRAPHGDDGDRVMRALANHQPSHAQRYNRAIIEDLA